MKIKNSLSLCLIYIDKYIDILYAFTFRFTIFYDYIIIFKYKYFNIQL